MRSDPRTPCTGRSTSILQGDEPPPASPTSPSQIRGASVEDLKTDSTFENLLPQQSENEAAILANMKAHGYPSRSLNRKNMRSG